MRLSGLLFFISIAAAVVAPTVGCYLIACSIYNRMVEGE